MDSTIDNKRVNTIKRVFGNSTMSEEERIAAEQAAAAANGEGLDPVKAKALIEELANLRQDKSNLVAEIKTLRTKKDGESVNADVIKEQAKAVVAELLSENQKAETANARRLAEEKFKNTVKEFHPDNDPGGLKFDALMKKFSRFNTGELKTVDEYLEAYDEANILLNKDKIVGESYSGISYAATPSSSPQSILAKDDSGLSAEELRLIKSQGIDKEKYLKMKQKRPEYVKTLLQFSK